MPAVDIIIPAHNNARELPLTLRSLFDQDVPGPWLPGVILSDDGSTDATLASARPLTPPSLWRPTVVIAGTHQGSAGARNRGLKQSKADVVMFLGADIILRPAALAAHLEFHLAHPAAKHAALGMIRWDPRLVPSPVMEWMMHGGGQNDFDTLLGRLQADPRHFFYGSHLSLKRSTLAGTSFPEIYHTYGWEDLDLGRRLAPRLTLHVLSHAVGLHRHAYAPRDIWRRQYLVGQSLVTYQQRYPDVVLIPRQGALHRLKIAVGAFSGAAPLLRAYLSLTARYWSTPRLFALLAALQLWRGVYTKLPAARIGQHF